MGSEWVGKGCVFLGFCNEMMKTYVHGIAKLHVMVLAASALVGLDHSDGIPHCFC